MLDADLGDVLPQATDFAASASTSTPGTVTNVQISGAIFIPIVAVVGGIFGAVALVVLRRQISNLIRKILRLPPLPEQTVLSRTEDSTGLTQISAEQLAGSTGNLLSPSSGNDAGAASRGRRARRGVRRTDSGHSIRTLPVYSKEAGDEELVLVRRRSAVDGEVSGTEGQRERRISLSSVLSRVMSLRRSGSVRSSAGPAIRDETDPTRSDPTETLAPAPASDTSDNRGIHEVVNPVAEVTTATNPDRRTWGDAPHYPQETSPANVPVLPQPDIPPPRAPTLRERTSSTFRGLLARTGLSQAPPPHTDPYLPQYHRHQARRPSSTVSLLLQPQMSRFSTQSPDRTNTSFASPWASTHSLGLISSPIPHSAIRASFETADLPRAGLSDDQMRFLASSEAVNLAGVRVGEVPVGQSRRELAAACDYRSDGRERDGERARSGITSTDGRHEDLMTGVEASEMRRAVDKGQTRNTQRLGQIALSLS